MLIPYRRGRIKAPSLVAGFTLLEVMVAVAVFSLVMTGISGVLLSIQQGWQRQKAGLDLVQNARWSMEFMVNEIRQGGNLVPGAGDRLQFELPSGDGSNRIWYWRGDGGNYGNMSMMFRGRGADLGNANDNRQELANLIVDNPSGNNIFKLIGDLLTIELTTNKEGRNYTLRSQVRPRN